MPAGRGKPPLAMIRLDGGKGRVRLYPSLTFLTFDPNALAAKANSLLEKTSAPRVALVLRLIRRRKGRLETLYPLSILLPNKEAPHGGAVSAHREDKRDRLEYAKRLLRRPDECHPNPVQLVNDTVEKQELRNNAWALWEILDGALDEGPMNPERGFSAEVVKMAKMGKEFLSMARTGDHFSAGKVIMVWARQTQQSGRCDRCGFDPEAYQKAAMRYGERRRCRVLQ